MLKGLLLQRLRASLDARAFLLVEAFQIEQEREEKDKQPFLVEILKNLHELQLATPCRTSSESAVLRWDEDEDKDSSSR